MQVNTTLTNQELSTCLDVLYAAKSSTYVPKRFKCIDSQHRHLKNAIQINGPEEEMKKVVLKVQALDLKYRTGVSIAEIDYFHSSANGMSRLTLTNERSVNIFKEALYKDLQSDVTALNTYTLRTEYKRASL